jgi:hypothetical protein
MIQKILISLGLYVIAFGLDYAAINWNLPVLWIIFLPISTAAVVFTFDLIVTHFDFDEIKHLKGSDKYLYIIALSILCAGFAVATAIFLK